MTGAEFRAWRRGHDLTRAGLLAVLHGLGWTNLTIHTVNVWATRGPPPHAVALFRVMDTCPAAWDTSAPPKIGPDH